MFNFFIIAVLKAPKGSGIMQRMDPLIDKLTEFALPAAIVVSLFGLIQFIFGDPSGKERIRMAMIGFIGVFVIPMVFYTIWEAFHGM